MTGGHTSATWLATPLSELVFAPRFMKLIKRLAAMGIRPDTIGTLLALDPGECIRLGGFGKTYADSLVTLQTRLREGAEIALEWSSAGSLGEEVDVGLGALGLTRDDRAALDKLELVLGRPGTLRELLKVRPTVFGSQKGVRPAHVQRLRSMQARYRRIYRGRLVGTVSTSPPLQVSSAQLLLSDFVLERRFVRALSALPQQSNGSATVGDFLELRLDEVALHAGLDARTARTLSTLRRHFLNPHLLPVPPEVESVLSANAHIFLRENSWSSDPVVSRLLRCLPRHANSPPTVGMLLKHTATPSGVAPLALLRQAVATACTAPPLDATGLPTVGHIQHPDRIRLAPSMLERCIIEDLEDYLGQLPVREREIFVGHWGYDSDTSTLDSFADQYGVSRARAGQLSGAASAGWLRWMRVHPSMVRNNVSELFAGDLKATLPTLAGAFRTDERLLRFLEFSSGVEHGTFLKTYDATRWTSSTSPRWLDPLFAETPSPVSRDTCTAFLGEEYGLTESQAEHWLTLAEAQGHCECNRGVVVPRALSQPVAVAHVLLDYPMGLPWSEAARAVNYRRISRASVSLLQVSHAFDSEYLWLCGVGTYCHIEYFDVPRSRWTHACEAVRDLLRNRGATANLRTISAAVGPALGLDRFELRHILSTHGAEGGLYFEGSSRADTVSLQPITAHATLADAILGRLAASRKPLRPEDLAVELDASINLIMTNLYALADTGRVVRVDRSSFTTPENAFAEVDTQALAELIGALLRRVAMPVEVDVLREQLNRQGALSYSKHFWLALARHCAPSRGWHVQRTLLWTSPLPWEGLRELVLESCSAESDRSRALVLVRGKVLLTDVVANSFVATWISHALRQPR